MTASAAIQRRSPSRPAGQSVLRTTTWALHVTVSVLAVFSLCCNGFQWWVDLRMLGGGGTALTKIFWAATVLVVPWCAGPRLTGLRRPTWSNAGWSADWARRLLWPTYFVMACLVANSVYYYQLVWLGHVDTGYPIPMPLLAALLLAAWCLCTRQWLRSSSNGSSPATRRTQLWAAAFGVLQLAIASAFFLLYAYARPLTGPVDLAVVLGNRVMPDGTASITLRDRTLAAVSLYKRGLARHLYLSGAVSPPAITGGPPLDEPRAMKQVCLDNGIPEDDITLDPDGINTRATAYDTARFMRAKGYNSVVVCTDQFHLYRSAKCLRDIGIEPFTARSHPVEWQCADPFATVRDLVAVGVYTLNPRYHQPRIFGMKLVAPRVIVRKTAGLLEMYDGTSLIKTYKCITGGNMGDKSVEGDRRTPLGKFHIVFKNPNSKFHLSLGLDYPTAEDAQRGLASGLITKPQYDQILEALQSDLSLEENQKKLWYTALGGEIFIHGYAEGRSGTAGCIAVSNSDIEELFSVLTVGTPVEIRP